MGEPSPWLTHVQELVKGVFGVLAGQHQQPPVALLLQRCHLSPDVVVSQGRALWQRGVGM